MYTLLLLSFLVRVHSFNGIRYHARLQLSERRETRGQRPFTSRAQWPTCLKRITKTRTAYGYTLDGALLAF
uniref:Putative secreted protein n=1 Tax=Rhipicephalus microplus TaxID=6941 RepID=A0A6M2DBS6_RHIMP